MRCFHAAACMTLILLMMLLILDTASAETYVVDDDDGDWADFSSIQDALNGSTDGDVIQVYDGEYMEALSVENQIILTGNGSRSTTIEYSIGDSIDVLSENVSISGFLINGSPDANAYSGIHVDQHENATIEYCRISNYFGYGIRAHLSSNITVRNCSINSVRFGITISSSNDWVIDNCTLNESSYTAISIGSSDRGMLVRTNSTDGGSTGLSISGSSRSNTIKECNFINNSGYGVTLDRCGFVVIDTIKCIDNGRDSINSYRSRRVEIRDSQLDQGVYLWNVDLPGASSHLIENCFVGERPLRFHKNGTDKAIEGDPGQVILINMTDSIVSGVNVSNVPYGVHIGHSSNISCIDARMENCRLSGLYIYKSEDVIVHNISAIDNCGYTSFHPISGVYIYQSNRITLNNSDVSENNEEGLFANQCDRLQISNSTFHNNSNDQVRMFDCWNVSIIQNQISRGNGTLGDGAGIYINDGNGRIENNSVIWMREGIDVEGDNFTIGLNSISRCDDGLIMSASDSIIEANHVHDNRERGLVAGGRSNSIWNNTVNNNTENGLYLDHLDNGSVVNNFVANTTDGAGIEIIHSKFLNLTNNRVENCSEYGILGMMFNYSRIINCDLYANEVGIGFHDSKWSVVRNSTINASIRDGIYIGGGYSEGGASSNNRIVSNKISYSLNHSINLSSRYLDRSWTRHSAFDNLVYLNTIIDNGGNDAQAVDWGRDNMWDNGKVGNHWSDYGWTDDNSDGIGDYPYIIDGPSLAEDRYPCMESDPSASLDGSSYPRTRYVDDDQGNWAHYTWIMDAVNASDSNDTVMVYNGSYSEEFEIEEFIHLIGNGSSETFMSTPGAGPVLEISSNRTMVRGFTISANQTGQTGILLGEARRVTIYSCELIDCGIVIEGSTLDHYSTHNLTDCKVNGRPIIYALNSSNQLIESGGQIIAVNCTGLEIINASVSNSTIGILLAYSNNTRLDNCTISIQNTGVKAVNCTNITILNSHVSNCTDVGINIVSCLDTGISGVVLRNNSGDGFHIQASNGVSLDNFTSESNGGAGIRIVNSGNATISGDLMGNGHAGLFIDGVINASIVDCNSSYSSGGYMSNRAGIFIRGSRSINIRSSALFNNSGHGILAHSSGLNVDRCVIYNNSLHGMYSTYSDHELAVKRSRIFNNSENGVYFTDCEMGIVRDCIIYSNSDTGIQIYQGEFTLDNVSSLDNGRQLSIGNGRDISIQNSTFMNGTGSVVFGVRVDIEGSIFSGSEDALRLYLRDSSITDCLFENNNNSLNFLYTSENLTIDGNEIKSNDGIGIIIDQGARNILTDNRISGNGGLGIALGANSSNNLVHDNYLEGNNGNGIQAEDHGSGNDWNSTAIGNYWSTYNGSDDNGDSIGDAPHDIGGSAGSKDHLPIVIHKTWVVDDDNGPWADHDNIQDAINASTLGDTILVYAGTYGEWVNLDKGVHVIGNGSAECTVYQRQVQISGEWASFQGFSVIEASVSSGGGINVTGSNITVSDNNCSGNLYGIVVDGASSRNITIVDNILSNNTIGINIEVAEDVNLIDNYVHNNTEGIKVMEADEVMIQNCTVNDHDTYEISIYYSSDLSIDNCSLNGSDQGSILIAESSDNIDITNCSITGDNIAGIVLKDCENVTISNCSIFNNYRGIVLRNGSKNITITGNEIYLNYDFGIIVGPSCSNSTVYLNNLYWNGNGSGNFTNAWDDAGIDWDDGTFGNHWSDYNGTDGNGDGIGDTAYDIDGSAGSTDRYPLMDPADTGAPSKVPEFLFLPVIIAVYMLLIVWRRHYLR